MLRASRTLFSALKPMKASTGITGLEAHPDPLPALKQTYTSTLNLLGSLPSTSVYRQATEALTKHRLQNVESSGEDVAKFESSLGSMAEVILEEAKSEQQLIGKMIEWKGWESLETPSPPNQWRYFDPQTQMRCNKCRDMH